MRAAHTLPIYRCRYTPLPTVMSVSACLVLVSGITLYIASWKTDDDLWSRWIITPIAGASAACAVAMLFSSARDKPKVIGGRIICAGLSAVIIPRFLAWQWPTLMTWVQDIILLFGGGVVLGLLGWFGGKAAVERLAKEVPSAADRYTRETIRKIRTGKNRGRGHNRSQHYLAQDEDEP